MRCTVAKLMKQNGIRPARGKRRVPITTDSRHAHVVAPNMLDRNFEIPVPDTVWLADISYIPTDEGWLYLAAVKDLATMEIVGLRCINRAGRQPTLLWELDRAPIPSDLLPHDRRIERAARAAAARRGPHPMTS